MTVERTDGPLAYLITFHTYGSWLHGSHKGSVDREHNRPGATLAPSDPARVAAMRRRSLASPTRLNQSQRAAIDAAILSVCEHRGWGLHALNVRTNHVHAVVTAATTPERVMNDFKSWATRRLRQAGLADRSAKVWSRHGSTRYLWDQRAVEAACRYVVEAQGPDLL